MNNQSGEKIVSSELSSLWTNYQGDAIFKCFIKHFQSSVEDEEIQQYLSKTLNTANSKLENIEKILRDESIPVPLAFDSNDVRKNSSKLFEDDFVIFYLKELTRTCLKMYARAVTNSFRKDIVEYFHTCANDSIKIYKETLSMLEERKLLIKAPEIAYPTKIEFEKNTLFQFLERKKHLTVNEIEHLYININSNLVGQALMTAFEKVTTSGELKAYFKEGKKLAQKQIETFSSFLTNEELSVPGSLEIYVKNVEEDADTPFSERFMLFHVGLAVSGALENIGVATTESLRMDILKEYASFAKDIGQFGNKGKDIMIKNGWFENPPSTN